MSGWKGFARALGLDQAAQATQATQGAGGGDGAPDACQQAIRRADTARDRQDWQLAAVEYRAALASDAGQAHIWVQLGHALKEQGNLPGASQSYQQALILQPGDAETHLHLAHVLKNLGLAEPAVGHFLRAFHFGLESAAEERELSLLLARLVEQGRHDLLAEQIRALETLPGTDGGSEFLARIRAVLARQDGAAAVAPGDAPEAQPLVFDVSDLIGFWRSARLPTGIQRVQIETICGALDRDTGRSIRLCCFTNARDNWLEVPVDIFQRLTQLATVGSALDDAEWVAAAGELDLHLSLVHPFEFPNHAILINLGTSWWLQNYFLFVRHAKATKGIRYVPFVHDMIPVMAPEHCTRGLTQDFISWVLGVFEHADHYLVNSRATAADLRKVGAIMGHRLDPAEIAVIPLDSDFRKDTGAELGDEVLEQWALVPGGFVLFVSTVESRKGHLHAFDAWADLVARHGADKVPQLVCVGNRGWLNDRVYERLALDPVLASKVTMLQGLSDAELALLYRRCSFTIYPSLYEGWGLPVTESLCYGKVPLVSNAASLPEAGGSFAVYASPGSSGELMQEAERLIFDAAHRAGLEQRIAQDFRPRKWSDLATQIVDEVERFAIRDASAEEAHVGERDVPLAHIGSWHSLERNTATRIWPGIGTSEKYRSNLGWYWPEDRGCRVRTGAGGELMLHLPEPHGRLRILFLLRGDEREMTRYSISVDGTHERGNLACNEEKWVWLDLSAEGAAHDLTIRCAAEPAPEGNYPTYFVRGFHLCDLDDREGRSTFMEAVALGRLDLLDAFRERDVAVPQLGQEGGFSA